jgi:hypothetical protein
MKKKLLIATMFFVAFAAQSQVKDEKKETTESPNRIKVYTPTGSVTNSRKKDNSYKWMVKTDLLGMVVGEFPIIGEYRLTEKTSIEASLGMTYSYLGNKGIFDKNNNNNSGNISSDLIKPSTGGAYRATFKYYPSSDYDALEGWNFGVQVFSKTSNSVYDTQNSSQYKSINGLKDVRVDTGVALIIGFQNFGDSNIASEWFLGIGFAKTTQDSFNYYSVTNGSVTTDVTTPISNESSGPSFQVG